MKKLILILSLLSTPAIADNFRMKCKVIQGDYGGYVMTLCEDENNSCFFPKVWGQQPFCIKK